MYKIVAIDLDGTLLNSCGIVTNETKKVLEEAMNRGIDIVIASGRPIDSIKTIAQEIKSKKYFIAGNGAVVYDIQKDKAIYEKYMSKAKVLEIIKLCEENSIIYNVYTDKTILAKALKYNVLYYHKENLKKQENEKTSISIVKNMYDYVKSMKEEKFLKITICEENKIIFNSIIKKIKEIKEIEVLDVLHMSKKTIKQGTEEITMQYHYAEISSSNVDKWNAIEFLMNEMNIKKDEVIAIGDNINDKKMIENAGIGIAMSGSTPNVTQVADYITCGNNEEGVAKAIKKYLKEQE